MDRTPKPMEQYIHFKGGRYQVLNLAEMEETGETLVIYQALYGEGKIYARPLSGFVSEVDHVRYPAVSQRWRFLRVIPPEPEENMPKPPADGAIRSEAAAEDGKPADVPEPDPVYGSRETDPVPASKGQKEAGEVKPRMGSAEPDAAASPVPGEEEMQLAPAVLQFLDAETADGKLGVLAAARGTLTDDMIDTMAFALGIDIEPGPMDSRYQDLRECLLTISRYEMDRDRFRSTWK